jgi:hypothetical protein
VDTAEGIRNPRLNVNQTEERKHLVKYRIRMPKQKYYSSRKKFEKGSAIPLGITENDIDLTISASLTPTQYGKIWVPRGCSLKKKLLRGSEQT